MDFLNPYLLWATAGVAVPVAIHLLNRFRYRQVDWAAMELLRRALVVRAQRIRLEDLLLLLLRSAAVLLAALAFARMTLAPSSARWLGAGADVGAVIAIDGSYSMDHRPGVRSRFEGALERAREAVDTLDAGSPASIVLLGGRPRILLRDVGIDAARGERALEEAAPLPESLDLEASLEEAEALLSEVKAPVRELYLVTDAQRATWESVSEKVRALLSRISERATLFLVPVEAAGDENLAIESLELASGALRAGSRARYVVRVRNQGGTDAERIAVRLLQDGVAVDERVLDVVPAGKAVDAPLFARFDESGSVRLSARLEGDPLDRDNVRRAVARVRDKVRVLVVDGEPSPDPYASETGYLVAALTAAGGESGGVFVNTVPWLELAAERLTDYDVVLLANVPDVHPDQAAAFYDYAMAGGDLIVFLGPRAEPALLDARMRRGDEPILPAAIAEPVEPAGGAEGGAPIEIAAPEHPLCRPLAALQRDLLHEARVFRQFALEPHDGARVLLRTGGSGAPLLAERTLGRGNVLLFATTADREWTNAVAHPIYPILIQQALTHLTREDHERPATVGEDLVITVSTPTERMSFPGPGEGGGASFADPTGGEFPLELDWSGGVASARLETAEHPGFYELRRAGSPPLPVAVNVDPRESDVKTLSAPELEAALAGLALRVVPPGEPLSAAVKESRVGRELWRELLAAALAVLLLEAFLAWIFSRRTAARVAAGKETS